MGATKAAVAKLQKRVLKWFGDHGRAFPWREHRDPYATLVAEVMLQQTQTGRVAPSYTAFLQQFPDVESLARAPAMDVIRAWKGLGYNRRAVDLQRAAQQIVHAGEFPRRPKELKKLPGVAEYTSSALACFAFDEQVAVIDVNVRRVLARSAFGAEPEDAERKRVDDTARAWLPAGDAYEWNQALMDIGAMLCRPDAPLCGQCPMKTECRYYAKGKHRRPRAPRAPKQPPFEGSNRQKRGGIVDALRASAGDGITLGALARALHPSDGRGDLTWLVQLLEGLERDGLVAITEGARRGSARGLVKLPG
jgi:A/G-specific adenine glycosylase